MNGSDNILVVDDNEDIANLIRDFLNKGGYSALEFYNPQKAFEFFGKDPERFSMVITDVRMPSMSGIELVSKVRLIQPKIKAILITAFDRDTIDSEIEVHRLEAIEILKKPVHLRKLQESVNRNLDTIGVTYHK